MNARLAVLGVDGQRNSAGKSFLAKGVTFAHDAKGEVPVWLAAEELRDRDLTHLLGRAKLSVHDGVIWAECELLDDRLPSSLMKILYPHVCGKLTRLNGDVIAEMVVDGINISFDSPQDSRIPSLESQGIKARRKG
jgi:hypothetical protein